MTKTEYHRLLNRALGGMTKKEFMKTVRKESVQRKIKQLIQTLKEHKRENDKS